MGWSEFVIKLGRRGAFCSNDLATRAGTTFGRQTNFQDAPGRRKGSLGITEQAFKWQSEQK
jgi:hypothetical protein